MAEPKWDRDEFDRLWRANEDLEKRIREIENNARPTVPIYDPAQFPLQAVEGQIALGSDDKAYKYQNGIWSEIGGGGAEPFLTDYFSNSYQWLTNPTPSNPTNYSDNTISWVPQSSWTGYPTAIIGSDLPTDNGEYIFVDLVAAGALNPALIKVEFSCDLFSFNPGTVIDAGAGNFRSHTGPGAWTTGYGPWYASYGSRSDFPITVPSLPSFMAGGTPQPSLSYYVQTFGGSNYRYFGVHFGIRQSYPGGTSSDFQDQPFCQANFSILKRDVFEGSL